MHILAHGIDLVEVCRIEKLLIEHPTKFAQRVFTEQEQIDCGISPNAKPDVRAPHRLAARFAAKEAAMKALGTGLASGVAWHDFSVTLLPTGRPVLILAGQARVLAKQKNLAVWHVSLTHTRTHAMASVIAHA